MALILFLMKFCTSRVSNLCKDPGVSTQFLPALGTWSSGKNIMAAGLSTGGHVEGGDSIAECVDGQRQFLDGVEGHDGIVPGLQVVDGSRPSIDYDSCAFVHDEFEDLRP